MKGVHHSLLSCQDCAPTQFLSIWRNSLPCRFFFSSIKSFILRKCIHSKGCCPFPQSSLFTAVTWIFTSLQLLMHISSWSVPFSSFGTCTSPQLYITQFSLNSFPGHYTPPGESSEHKVRTVEEEYSKLLKTKPQLQRPFHTQYLYTLFYHASSK